MNFSSRVWFMVWINANLFLSFSFLFCFSLSNTETVLSFPSFFLFLLPALMALNTVSMFWIVIFLPLSWGSFHFQIDIYSNHHCHPTFPIHRQRTRLPIQNNKQIRKSCKTIIKMHYQWYFSKHSMKCVILWNRKWKWKKQ